MSLVNIDDKELIMSSSKPGSINKTLLTPCRQVGLSRKRKTPSSVKNPSVIKPETSGETPLKQPLGKSAPLISTNSPHTPNIESQNVNIISENDNKKLEKATNKSEPKPTPVGKKSKKTPVSKDKSRKRVSRNLLLEDDNTTDAIKESKAESHLQESPAGELKTAVNEKDHDTISITNQQPRVILHISEKKPIDSTPDKPKNDNTKSDSKKSDKFKRILSVKSTFSSEEVFVENGSTDQASLEENAVIALVELSNREVAEKPTHCSRKILDDDEDFVPSQKENKTRKTHKKLEKVKKLESKSKCKRIMSTDSEDDAKSVSSVTNIDEKENIMEAENLSVGTSTLVSETVDQLHICTPTPDVSVTEDKFQVENESTPVTKVERGRKSKRLRRCLCIKKTNSFDDSMEVDDCPKKEVVVALEKEPPIVEEFSNFDVDKIASKSVPETIPEHVNEDDAFTSTPEEDKFGRHELISQIAELETRIKKKRNYLIHLKQAQTFEKKNNIDEVKNLFTVWKKGCIQVLNDLLPKLETHGTMDMATLLKNLQIPPDIISISPKGELI